MMFLEKNKKRFIFLGAFLLCVIIVEFAIRVFFPQGSFYLFHFDRKNNIRKNKVVLRKPDVPTAYRSIFPLPYFTNVRGEVYSDNIYPFEKKKKDLRILLVGGSNMIPFLEGAYEKNLGKTVELINCSMVASNFLSYYQNLKTNCARYKEVDIVVFQVNLFPQDDVVNSILGLFYGEYITDNPDYYIYAKLQDIQFPHGEDVDSEIAMSFPITNEDLEGYLSHHFVNNNSLYEKLHSYRFIKNSYILLGLQAKLKKLSQVKVNMAPRIGKSLYITKEIRNWFPDSRIIMMLQSNMPYQKLVQHQEYWSLWNEFRQKTKPYNLEYLEAYHFVTEGELADYNRHFSEALYQKMFDSLVSRILLK